LIFRNPAINQLREIKSNIRYELLITVYYKNTECANPLAQVEPALKKMFEIVKEIIYKKYNRIEGETQ
jgi:hypothetical protein